MVAGDGHSFSSAHMIAARISNVGNDGLIMTQRAGDDRGRHAFSSSARMQSFIMDRGIGELDETGQQADERSSRWRESKFIHHYVDCFRGCDITEVQAADSIRNYKHPTMRLRFLAGFWDKRAHGIFIVRPKLARIARLAEEHTQHDDLPETLQHGLFEQVGIMAA
jgi:hypothetical protein